MPLWRCPHCATPQPESARCWLCGRSTTTCAACRHYRRGVAGGFGLCGKSPRRLALRGTEVFPCWEAVPMPGEATATPDLAAARERASVPDGPAARTFVPVDELRAVAGRGTPAAAPVPTAGAPAPVRWSLWGDPDA